MTGEVSDSDARALRDCVEGGGVAVFPTDTVYGVCCDPENEDAAQRLYELKGRPANRSSAVMFFALEAATAALVEMAEIERRAFEALLPGPVTLLLANRGGRFAPACRMDSRTLGLRVPRLPAALRALGGLEIPLMQSSANISGQPDARTLAEIPDSLREGADLVLDGGELAGTPSTVIDLRDYAATGRWQLLREGALARDAVELALASPS
jgi:L-threonylcarbamoyladenylate synthase